MLKISKNIINCKTFDELKTYFSAEKNYGVIIRGASGSGKTTLARCFGKTGIAPYFEADMYFMHFNPDTMEMSYVWDRNQLNDAHAFCTTNMVYHMRHKTPMVIVSNTTCAKEHLEALITKIKAENYIPVVITCRNDFGNTHNVPDYAITRQKEQIKQSQAYENELADSGIMVINYCQN